MVGFPSRESTWHLYHRFPDLVREHIGESPSGKALASGASIRGFESLLPSQVEFELNKERSDEGKPKILGPS